MKMKKFSFTKCGSSRYFSSPLAVFEERGEPACGRAAEITGAFPRRRRRRKSSELI